MTSRTDDRPVARTPLWERHREAKARMIAFAGFEMPLQYRGIVAEHHAVRQRAGLFDVSHMGRLLLEGPEAASAVDRVVTNWAARLRPGRALYTVACNEQGGILDDLVVYRTAEQTMLVVCNAVNRGKMRQHFEREARRHGGCTLRDVSEQTALLALQGPCAAAIAQRMGWPEAAELRRFGCRTVSFEGRPVLIARTSYTGEDGFELMIDADHAALLWDRLLEVGAPLGLQPAGLGARDTLRLEARLLLYGQDMDERTDPFEAGLGWTVKLQKGPFVGREALQRKQQRGPERLLVGFEVEGRGNPRPGCALLDPDSGEVLGRVTSGGPSPTLRKGIGLGYVPASRAASGERLLVEVRGRRLPVRIVQGPFYRRNP